SWASPQADVWLIQREQVSPEQYAETWLQDASEARDRRLYQDSYAAYLDDFASRNVEAIGFGMIWLRRPAEGSPVLRRFEEITYPIEQPVGPHLGAAVERTDWVAGHELSGAHLVVAEDVTEERHQRPGAEHPGVILLRQGAGLRRTNLLSTELAGFVSACDGDLSAGQIIGALEALLGGGEDWDAETFRGGILGEVGNLVRDGFLLPA
ncbi:MAG: SAM-dependent methyltransferase, partial [Arthrobacter sp.]